MHHVAVRHGNVTSVRDVVLMSLFPSPWGWNSSRFKEHILIILFGKWRIQSFRACFSDQSLASSGLHLLEPLRLAGSVASHGIPEALLISNVPSGIVHDFLIIRIVVRNKVNASLLSHCVQLLVFLLSGVSAHANNKKFLCVRLWKGKCFGRRVLLYSLFFFLFSSSFFFSRPESCLKIKKLSRKKRCFREGPGGGGEGEGGGGGGREMKKKRRNEKMKKKTKKIKKMLFKKK